MEAAKRELYEESGITDATLYPVCDYYGYNSKSHSNGVVFLAIVKSLGIIPKSEMQEIKIFDKLPNNLTYPEVTPLLMEEAYNMLKKEEGKMKISKYQFDKNTLNYVTYEDYHQAIEDEISIYKYKEKQYIVIELEKLLEEGYHPHIVFKYNGKLEEVETDEKIVAYILRLYYKDEY